MSVRREKLPTYASEAEMCAQYIAEVEKGAKWTAYAETAGWDILLVRKADGFQIGIEAKLRLNAEVLFQAIEGFGRNVGPDCRAILVPCGGGTPGIGTFASFIGITIIRISKPQPNCRTMTAPYLPEIGFQDWTDHTEWHELAPLKRHPLPEYVPDVAAGASAPTRLTSWKIGAIKLTILLRRRGYLTRADFKALKVDIRRWLPSGAGFLISQDGVLVAGPSLPDFQRQHPVVYAQIEADFEVWAPKVETAVQLVLRSA